jgi:hypothetical protein
MSRQANNPVIEGELLHRSIADIPEDELVANLITTPYWRSIGFDIAGMPPAPTWRQKVDLADAPGGRKGDIDVLLCPLNDPEQSVAIEVKRIKFGAGAIITGQPNKLTELKKDIRQANLLAKIGFSQVYFYIFVVVDTRQLNLGKDNSYAGLSVELKSKLELVLSFVPAELHPRVGLYRTKYGQTKDSAPLGEGTFYGHLVRRAQVVSQPPELTKWVKMKFTEPHSRLGGFC